MPHAITTRIMQSLVHHFARIAGSVLVFSGALVACSLESGTSVGADVPSLADPGVEAQAVDVPAADVPAVAIKACLASKEYGPEPFTGKAPVEVSDRCKGQVKTWMKLMSVRTYIADCEAKGCAVNTPASDCLPAPVRGGYKSIATLRLDCSR